MQVLQPLAGLQPELRPKAETGTMPVNLLTEACICRVREAMVFWSPSSARLQHGTSHAQAHPRLHGRVQIVDVFSLEIATGYSRDPQGRLLLHAAPSVAEGRSWSLAKATQLIRNDARPHRWVALQMDNRAWGLFWPVVACNVAGRSWPLQSAMPRSAQL